MRIRRLSLDRFGRFSEQAFDFGDGGGAADFHVVYGPNEAGKTTTMEGFLRLLYGFPHREPYDYLHQRKNLSVSAELDLNGALRHLTRLPTRTGSLRGETGSALPEAVLAAHLGGLALEDYRSLLCLDDATIEQGGRDIANARGDIGKLLFSAAAGVANLNAVLEEARAEADALFRKRASTTRMAGLRKDLAAVEQQIRELDVSAGAWRKLKEALQTAQADEHAARERRDALRARQAEVAAAARALPLLQERDRLVAEVAPFAEYPASLDLNPEDLVALKTQEGTAEAEIARLEREIATAREVRDGIEVDPGQLALASALDALDELRSRARTAALDLPRRRQALHNAREDMAGIARDLGCRADADPADLIHPAARITELETAREAMREARLARDAGQREAALIEARIPEATDALAAMRADAPGHDGVADLLLRFDADALAPDYAAARQAIDAAEAHLAELLDGLAVGGRTFADVPPCPVTVEEAERQAAAHADRVQDIEQAQKTLADLEDDDELNAARRANLIAGSKGLSDAEAGEAQAGRDALWQAHRAALSEASADAFETAMTRVDDVNAARLAHAREVGELRQLEQARIETDVRTRQAATKLASLKEAVALIEVRVGDAAKALGLPEMMPGDFSAWVERHSRAGLALRQKDRLVERHRPIVDRANRLLAALRPLLPQDEPDFATALAAARRLADEERAYETGIAAATEALKHLEKDLERHRSALVLLGDRADQAHAAWNGLVRELFGDVLEAKDLEAGLGPLRDLREQETKRAQAARQVTTMEDDQQQFARAVADLAGRHDVADPDPLEAFDALRGIAKHAAAEQHRRDGLAGQIEEKAEALDTARRRLAGVERQVRDFGGLFPKAAATDTLDALRGTVARAREVIDTRTRIAELARQIFADLSVSDLNAARSRLEDATSAGLAAEAETLAVDLDPAEARLSEATAARAGAERDLAAITGNADIAELVERRTTIELQIEMTLMAFLERDFGLRLAEEAIRRYRDSHRSAMMDATERAFRQLTNGAYTRLRSQPDGDTEILIAIDPAGSAKRVDDMSKGTRFQLYLALRAAAYEQLVQQGVRLPFFCDDVFETFDEDRTRAACRLMERIGRSGQAIYLTHHRHVVDIARDVCEVAPVVHELG